jgi:hypothetical protein
LIGSLQRVPSITQNGYLLGRCCNVADALEQVMDTHEVDGHFLPTSEEYANLFEGAEEDSN